jgi:hypothetical protein
MQAVETTRHPAPGGATGLPPYVSEEPPSLLLIPPGGGNQIGDQEVTRRLAFGRRLHAARHHRGVTLEDIARTTKVSPSLLAALEAGDASRWPKGLFRRAFFRDYVAAIGLSPDAHVVEFLQLFPDGEDHSTAVVVTPPETAAALRLTLAPDESWTIGRDRVRRELVDLIPILLLAVAVTLWIGSSPLMIPGIVALCYVGRLIGLARQQAASWRRRSGNRRASLERPPAA